jgi:hypothetical protein
MPSTTADAPPKRGKTWVVVCAAIIGLPALGLFGMSDPLGPLTFVLAAACLLVVAWFILAVYGKAPGKIRPLGGALSGAAVVGPIALMAGISVRTKSETLTAPAFLFVMAVLVLLWIGLGDSGTNAKGVVRGQERAAERERVAAIREQDSHAERVRQIQEWEAAYRDAHGGAEPPAGFMPPIAPVTGQTTNALAILALIFGFLGGVVAIPAGVVALSQIKKTGQAGRGMAGWGIALGSIWVAAGAALVIFAAVAGSSS